MLLLEGYGLLEVEKQVTNVSITAISLVIGSAEDCSWVTNERSSTPSFW